MTPDLPAIKGQRLLLAGSRIDGNDGEPGSLLCRKQRGERGSPASVALVPRIPVAGVWVRVPLLQLHLHAGDPSREQLR